jgi:hypothetical protein
MVERGCGGNKNCLKVRAIDLRSSLAEERLDRHRGSPSTGHNIYYCHHCHRSS